MREALSQNVTCVQPTKLQQSLGRRYVPTKFDWMATRVHYGTKWSSIMGDDVHPCFQSQMNTPTKYLGMTTTKHLQLAFLE
jgi:hypothetical protein